MEVQFALWRPICWSTIIDELDERGTTAVSAPSPGIRRDLNPITGFTGRGGEIWHMCVSLCLRRLIILQQSQHKCSIGITQSYILVT